jgi:hypothetical protein
MNRIESYSIVEYSSGQMTLLSACTDPQYLRKYFVLGSVCFFQYTAIIYKDTEICKQQVINNIQTEL